jgi:hypothetical protein
MRDINLTVADQIAVNVVNAHGSVIWTADAAERRAVAGWAGIVDINELPCRVANILNELCGCGMTRVF